jgi:glycosyltransferase involved in cell wall biosynthesis
LASEPSKKTDFSSSDPASGIGHRASFPPDPASGIGHRASFPPDPASGIGHRASNPSDPASGIGHPASPPSHPASFPPIRHRVLFLNRSYYPDEEATGQLLTQLCEDLAAEFDVHVVAGQPCVNPMGREYHRSGSRVHNGVTIHRVRNTRFNKSSSFGRLSNWLSYLGLSSLRVLAIQRPDVVVTETDPPFLSVLGLLMKRAFGCRLVVYLQDIYPDIGIAIGRLRDGFATRRLKNLFHRTYRAADRIVVLSEDMRSGLVEDGVRADKIVVIPNWIDCTRVHPVKQHNPFRERNGWSGKFVVMHSGNMGMSQGLDNVLRAAEIVGRQMPDAGCRMPDAGCQMPVTELRTSLSGATGGLSTRVGMSEIVFALIGDGAARAGLERTAREKNLTNVKFFDYQPGEHLAESLSAADVHILTQDPRTVRYLAPSKLYGILASGTPVVAIAPGDCCLARMICDEQVGYVVEPNNPQSLVDCILQCASLRDELPAIGNRARNLALARFARPRSIRAFSDLLLSVFENKGVRTHLPETGPSGASHK